MVLLAMEKLHVSASNAHPNIGAYKIPHLQSQFPPNPTPIQSEISTPSYLQFIDPIDIPPI